METSHYVIVSRSFCHNTSFGQGIWTFPRKSNLPCYSWQHMIGTTEAIIIGGVVLLLFGAKKLPELAKSMGQSKAAFDEGLKEGMSSEEDEDDES